ncbi:MAG TPA: hypothetical protein PLO14_03090 [Accumulibacter sp.]|uniref:hypothetical protein n=1 Tax=Accumulibacter sp. TaxID=2053492 RepID=UPI0025DF6BB0|nr:hypothetical protein [Accumulibacter sp.]MCM8599947.1 hypothetical protein [Accumulibacter sp.]MCM8664131.1 hypothetical protein [Accumulibacter sp.]HNC51213.1 hypothetical protein [Accumulibacter sp.]
MNADWNDLAVDWNDLGWGWNGDAIGQEVSLAADPSYRSVGTRRSFVTVGEERVFRSPGRARSFVA